MSERRKVIITCAVTGAIHTPSMSKALPVTPQEIAETRGMVSEHNLDIRTITMGISLMGCADENLDRIRCSTCGALVAQPIEPSELSKNPRERPTDPEDQK